MYGKSEKVGRLSRIVILTALSIVLRIIFGPFPNMKPLTAIFLVSLSYLGLLDALLLMTLTMVGSGLLFGFNMVVLWQVFSFGIVQLLWWLVIRPISLPLWLQSLLAVSMAFVYGFVISVFSATQFSSLILAFWLNGLVFDSLHAVSTLLFYPIIYHIFRRFYRWKKTVFYSRF